MNCTFCYQDDKIKDFTLKQIYSYIDNPDYSLIILSGGEPTIHKDFFQILDTIKSRNKLICISTNGIKLDSFKFVENMKKNGVGTVNLSLNALDNQILMKLEGDKRLQSKLQAMKNLKKMVIPTNVSFSLLKGVNESEFKKVFWFALKNNPVVRQFRARTYSRIGRYNDLENIYLSDFIDLLANATNIPPKEYIDFWINSDYSKSNSLYFIEYYDFIVNRSIAKRLKRFYPFYFFYLWKHLKFKNLLRWINYRFFNAKRPVFKIYLFKWPDKYDIDLEKTRFINLDYVALDGSINPFFETMMLNEKIRLKTK